MAKLKIEDIRKAAIEKGWTLISTEYKNFANLNTNIEESFGTCVISGYFTDKNSGSMNNGTVYLNSDLCDELTVKKLPKPLSVSKIDR